LEAIVIDSLMNMIFRCAHRRIAGPMARVRRPDDTRIDSYLVCLDCGKRFRYDTVNFQIGKVIETRAPEYRGADRA
jgi:hypothetical protein